MGTQEGRREFVIGYFCKSSRECSSRATAQGKTDGMEGRKGLSEVGGVTRSTCREWQRVFVGWDCKYVLKREQAPNGVCCGPPIRERWEWKTFGPAEIVLKGSKQSDCRGVTIHRCASKKYGQINTPEDFLNYTRNNFIGKRWQHPGFS